MSTKGYFMIHELVRRNGRSSFSTISLSAHPFAVVVWGKVEARFSNMECAQSSASEYRKGIIQQFNSEMKSAPGRCVLIHDISADRWYQPFLNSHGIAWYLFMPSKDPYATYNPVSS